MLLSRDLGVLSNAAIFALVSHLAARADILSSQFLGGGPLVAARQPRSFNHLVGA